MSRAFVLALLVLVAVPVAHAGLAQKEDRVDQDRIALRLETVKREDHGAYRLITLSNSDIEVREFINLQTKTTFAVAWNGKRMPDLIVLLGLDPAKLQPRSEYRTLRFVRIRANNLQFEASGRLGSSGGHCIRLDLVPHQLSSSLELFR